jgi:hypothetical protein
LSRLLAGVVVEGIIVPRLGTGVLERDNEAVSWAMMLFCRLLLSPSSVECTLGVLGVDDEACEGRRVSTDGRAMGPREDEVEARGSVGEEGSEGRRCEALLVPLICIEGTADDCVWATSREAFRRRGKRDVRVDRRRSVGRFSDADDAGGAAWARV